MSPCLLYFNVSLAPLARGLLGNRTITSYHSQGFCLNFMSSVMVFLKLSFLFGVTHCSFPEVIFIFVVICWKDPVYLCDKSYTSSR